MEEEIWKPVPSLNGAIEVSNLGRARRAARPLAYKDGRKGTLPAGILRGGIGANGYHIVSVGPKKFTVHRLVAETFLEPPIDEMAQQTVNHKNGNKLDNRVENLEWATFAANTLHARDAGLNKQHGENTNLSKYPDSFIEAVRNVHAMYSPDWATLGRLFGITGCHASQIVKMETRARKTV
jgi:hypothetical protein